MKNSFSIVSREVEKVRRLQAVAMSASKRGTGKQTEIRAYKLICRIADRITGILN